MLVPSHLAKMARTETSPQVWPDPFRRRGNATGASELVPSSRLAARLFELSHAQLLEIAVAGCEASPAVTKQAEAILAANNPLAQRLVEGVLLSRDLAPHVLAPLPLEDGAAAAVCSLWAEGWKATGEGRRRLMRVVFDLPADLLASLIVGMAAMAEADSAVVRLFAVAVILYGVASITGLALSGLVLVPMLALLTTAIMCPGRAPPKPTMEAPSLITLLEIPDIRELILSHYDSPMALYATDVSSLETLLEENDGFLAAWTGAATLSQVASAWRRHGPQPPFLATPINAPPNCVIQTVTAWQSFSPVVLDLSGLDLTGDQISVLFKDDQISVMFGACHHLQHLNLSQIAAWLPDAAVRCIAEHCTQLRYLNLDPEELYEEDRVTAGALLAVSQRCVKLEELILGGICTCDDDVPLSLADHCPHLRRLNLWDNKGITDAGICALAEGCNQLKQLDCPGSLTDASLYALARHCPQLQDLRIGFASECSPYQLTNVAVEALAAGCPQLKTVELPGYWLMQQQPCPRLQVAFLC